MNGPMKMYKLQPIIRHDIPVALPDCMYKLKNIHYSRNQVDNGTLDQPQSQGKKVDILQQVKQFLKNIPEIPGLMELAARQEQILKQLGELKDQIQSIKINLKLPKEATSNVTNVCNLSSRGPAQIRGPNQLPTSLVINANPSSPPYSIEIIQRLFHDSVTLSVSSYLHSSVGELSEPAKTLVKSLTSFKGKLGVPVVEVRVIWKNITSNAELVLDHSTPVCGEVNILRYLSRSSNSSLNYDTEKNAFEIDSLLDQSYLLARVKTKNERTSILQGFNKSLGKAQFLAGRPKAGIADIAAYSAIKQTMASNELGANIGKWYERCNSLLSK